MSGYDEGQKEADLRNELSTCLTSHWRYCMAGVLSGIPIGLMIKGSKTLKSIPFIVGGKMHTARYMYMLKPIFVLFGVYLFRLNVVDFVFM